MTSQTVLSRRDFLKVSAVAGVGLVISLYVPGCTANPTPTRVPTITPTATPKPPIFFKPNLFVTIGNDGTVTLTCHRSEMGQGVRTALPMILAEELGADWRTIRVTQADADTDYGSQMTGGSQSVQRFYLPLRQAGATGRELLIAAAAQKWGTGKDECYAENGMVINKITKEQLPFKDLVETAMVIPVPTSVPLKDAKDFHIIGTPMGRVDNQDIVTGKAIYGMDVKVPGMLYAVVACCPVIGGNLANYDDTKAKSIPGVRDVVQVNVGLTSSGDAVAGVAVVAENTWSAIQGRRALEVTWNEGPHAALTSAGIESGLLDRAKRESQKGELTAYYFVPYYSHVPMEPINSVADVRDDRCEVWAPTQNPQGLKELITIFSIIPSRQLAVHVPLLGGGFGRRLESSDSPIGMPPVMHTTEAINISRAVGAPVHVVWTREDDIHNDYFHPLSVTRVSAPLDNIRSLAISRVEATSGPVPTGAWRAVTNVPEAFAHESFLDEFAAATKQDPIELRRQILNERARDVLDLAVEKAGWGTPLPPGYGRGVAVHSTWNVSPCAQIAEVSVDDRGNVRVQRVVCAVDCGLVINPDMVKAQMEGGILFGIGAALKGCITIEKGRVQQSNYNDYPILRMDEIPQIEVYLVPSSQDPTGIGEMANPPITAAIANAIYAATGKRIRRLPIRPEDVLAA